MSGLFYWDTSTLVKLYAPESDSPAYLALMKGRPERPVTSFFTGWSCFTRFVKKRTGVRLQAARRSECLRTTGDILQKDVFTEFRVVVMYQMRRGAPLNCASLRTRR